MPKIRRRPRLSVSVAQAFDIYLLEAQARRYSPKTIAHYHTRVEPFVAWLESSGVQCIDEVRADHVRRWLVREGERGLAATTVHTAARALRAFLNFCVREEWLETSPMKSVSMPRKPKLIKSALDAAQMKRLLRADHSTRDQAIILLLLDTGIRAGELCALNLADVEMGTGTVRVRLGKGAKDRIVYMGSRSLRALAALAGRKECPWRRSFRQ